MSVVARAAGAAPYAVLLAFAAGFWVLADRIEYLGAGSRIGPDAWPKAILLFMGLLCLWEIGKRLFGRGAAAVDGILQSLMEKAEAADAQAAPGAPVVPPSGARLAAGMAVTLGYVLLVDVLGFFLATTAFLTGFALVGGYRRRGLALGIGIAGSLVLFVAFVKVVYVSLPLGVGPFRAVSLGLMTLLGVR